MPSATTFAMSEVAILSRVIQPDEGSLSAAAARAWLKVDFTDEDRDHMRSLAAKAQEGTLKAQDQAELESYRRIGRFLELIHSKARRSLKKRGASA